MNNQKGNHGDKPPVYLKEFSFDFMNTQLKIAINIIAVNLSQLFNDWKQRKIYI